MSFLDKFFRVDDVAEEEAMLIEQAHRVISFSQHSCYDQLMTWIETQADRPINSVDHLQMVKELARATALKEVRDHLRRQIKEAAAAIERTREAQ